MRTALIRKVLDSGQDAGDGKDEHRRRIDLWPRHDEFCHGHTHDETIRSLLHLTFISTNMSQRMRQKNVMPIPSCR